MKSGVHEGRSAEGTLEELLGKQPLRNRVGVVGRGLLRPSRRPPRIHKESKKGKVNTLSVKPQGLWLGPQPGSKQHIKNPPKMIRIWISDAFLPIDSFG